MYVYVRSCVFVCSCLGVFISTRAFVRTYMRACAFMFTCSFFICFVYIYACVRACVLAFLRSCVFVYACARAWVFACACSRASTCLTNSKLWLCPASLTSWNGAVHFCMQTSVLDLNQLACPPRLSEFTSCNELTSAASEVGFAVDHHNKN